MRIVCPNCKSAYEVDAAAIPEAGREVRCSQCKQVWHAMPVVAPLELGDRLNAEVDAKTSPAPADDASDDEALKSVFRDKDTATKGAEIAQSSSDVAAADAPKEAQVETPQEGKSAAENSEIDSSDGDNSGNDLAETEETTEVSQAVEKLSEAAKAWREKSKPSEPADDAPLEEDIDADDDSDDKKEFENFISHDEDLSSFYGPSDGQSAVASPKQGAGETVSHSEPNSDQDAKYLAEEHDASTSAVDLSEASMAAAYFNSQNGKAKSKRRRLFSGFVFMSILVLLLVLLRYFAPTIAEKIPALAEYVNVFVGYFDAAYSAIMSGIERIKSMIGMG